VAACLRLFRPCNRALDSLEAGGGFSSLYFPPQDYEAKIFEVKNICGTIQVSGMQAKRCRCLEEKTTESSDILAGSGSGCRPEVGEAGWRQDWKLDFRNNNYNQANRRILSQLGLAPSLSYKE
jgi:hypothetical protein